MKCFISIDQVKLVDGAFCLFFFFLMLLILCPSVIEKKVLTFPTIIVDLLISLCSSLNFSFMYFEALFLGLLLPLDEQMSISL